MSSTVPAPTCAAIDAVLAYLPDFELPDFEPGVWHHDREPGQDAPLFPSYEYNASVGSFVATCYEHGWITPFDWPAWQGMAQRLTEDMHALAKANARTIHKLITFHVRKDRFCEGHLAAMFREGHIVRLLRRLAAIRQAMDAQAS